MNFQTLIATKASRIVYAARGRPVFDFGARRAHGRDAGILAARASFYRGCKWHVAWCLQGAYSIFRTSARWHINLSLNVQVS